MILDSSAVLAILFREPGFEIFENALADAHACRISAASFVEVSILLESRAGDAALRHSDALFRQARIVIEAVTAEQALLARQRYAYYGKGRHAARLDFGHCLCHGLRL